MKLSDGPDRSHEHSILQMTPSFDVVVALM